MYCSEGLATITRLTALILWVFGATAHVAVLVLITRIYRKYHCFFMSFYTLMVFTRFLLASVKSTGYLLILINHSGVPFEVDQVMWFARFSSQAAALACVIERAYATRYATVYENSKRCSIITICFFVCTTISILAYFDNQSDIGRKINAVVYGTFLAIATVTLIVINKKLVIKSAAKSNLSERYQLTENVKALRLLLPFVVAISANAVFLSIGIVVFDVDSTFSLLHCISVPSYLPIFLIILIETTFFNFLAPLHVVHLNRAVVRRRKNGVANLAVKIVCNEKEHYFQQYKRQWS